VKEIEDKLVQERDATGMRVRVRGEGGVEVGVRERNKSRREREGGRRGVRGIGSEWKSLR
jgi:hypothetical protein